MLDQSCRCIRPTRRMFDVKDIAFIKEYEMVERRPCVQKTCMSKPCMTKNLGKHWISIRQMPGASCTLCETRESRLLRLRISPPQSCYEGPPSSVSMSLSLSSTT